MLSDKEFEKSLAGILQQIISGKVSMNEILEQVQDELEVNDIAECDTFMITDCYYTIKHLGEDNITKDELIYFFECFTHLKKYSLEEKNRIIVKALMNDNN